MSGDSSELHRDRLWRQVEALVEQGRAVDAEALLARYLDDNPGDARAHYQRGMLCFELDRSEAGLESMHRALALEPENSLVLSDLGLALEEAGRIEEAARAYRRATECRPVYPPAHANHARMLAREGQPQAAARHLHLALEQDPGLHRARRELAAVLHGMGELEESIACYRVLIAADGSDVSAHFAAAQVEMDRCGFEAAVDLLRACVAAEPGHAEAALALGACLQELGRMDEALQTYRSLLGRDRRYYYDVLKKLTSASRGCFYLSAATLRSVLLD